VLGKRWREIEGLRISVGKGEWRSVGMRSCRMRIVRPRRIVRSSSGGGDEELDEEVELGSLLLLRGVDGRK